MAIKWTNKSAIKREIDMAERHTDHAGCVNKTYHDLSITGICDEMDVPLWSECRQRNVIRQSILIRHKKEITSALIWKKRAAI